MQNIFFLFSSCNFLKIYFFLNKLFKFRKKFISLHLVFLKKVIRGLLSHFSDVQNDCQFLENLKIIVYQNRKMPKSTEMINDNKTMMVKIWSDWHGLRRSTNLKTLTFSMITGTRVRYDMSPGLIYLGIIEAKLQKLT